MLTRRTLLAAALVLAVATATTAQHEDQRDLGRVDLSWRVFNTTYMHYSVQSQIAADPIHPAQAGDAVEEPAATYVHWFGHEFNERGVIGRIHMPFTLSEVMFQLACMTPERRQRPGFQWAHKWEFDRIDGNPGDLTVDSTYVLTGGEERNGVHCALITGTHTRVAPAQAPAATTPHWVAFEATTRGWFNIDAGRLEGAEITIRSLAAVRDGSNKTKRTHFAWTVSYRFHRDVDSTEERTLYRQVQTAIGRGVERLWEHRNTDGSGPYGNQPRGGTALMLLTLLTCDVDPNDPRIIESFEYLKTTEMDTTYAVGTSLMAYEARYITEAERRAFLENPDSPPEYDRKLTPEDRREMERLVRWLTDNQNDENPFWNYSKGHSDNYTRFDFSVTQYALLGYAAAVRCNIRIPTGVVRRLIDGVMEYQMQDGPRIHRVTNYQPPRDPSRAGRGTLARTQTTARGWHYSARGTWNRYTEITNAYGSMTTAGLTCLMVAIDIANNMSPEDIQTEFGGANHMAAWQRKVQESMESGLAWLEHWYSVTRNPNRARYWYYYYLYGLERVLLMGNIRYLGEHHWYNQGAAALITLQEGNGGWGRPSDTCFALLFLKKGTVPARRPVYSGR